jgi:hypothetical protein
LAVHPDARAPRASFSVGEMHMKKVIRFSGMFAAAVIAALTLVSPASAQATRTWISGVGDDVNPCSRTAPCKTFAGAIAKTAAGGEIDTLDPGGFGAVTVTKAMTLADEGVGEAGILVAGTNGITVNCATDPNCVVIVRGLIIDGGPVGSNSLNGIRFIAGRMLVVQNCAIRNFTGGAPNGYGISFQPSATQAEMLFVDNTVLNTNGPLGGTGGGIFVQPTGSPTVTVSITNTQSSGNGFGVRTDSTQMSAGGSIATAVSDSELNGNAGAGAAAIANATAVPNVITIARTTIAHNSVGLNANGNAAASIHIGNSMMFDNATGAKTVSGGVIDSFGGNQFYNNPTGGGPSLTIIGPY